jgi:chromate transporter
MTIWNKNEQGRSMNSFLKMILNMFKIGLIGFGGGNALVPVIRKETVKEEAVSQEEFDRDVIVANITPGALPVELASGVGKRLFGRKGMVAAAVAMALPGTLLSYLVLACFSIAGDVISRNVIFASVGIAALIIMLLISYSVETVKQKEAGSTQQMISIFLIAIVFFLTSGKELTELFFLQIPLFYITTLDVLAVTFFVMFYTQGKLNAINIITSVGISFLYLQSVGEGGIITSIPIRRTLQLAMIVLAIYGLVQNIRKHQDHMKHLELSNMGKDAFSWLKFMAVCILPAVIFYPQTLLFVGKAIVSVLLSFGGGDAYIVIAKGLFVESMVSWNDFYGQVVTVSNAMPGSILCKMLTGVGFMIGKYAGPMAAFWIGLAGFGCAVGVSGLTFTLVGYAYDLFENLDIFKMIRSYIRPIIGGLLLTVSLSMLSNNIEIAYAYEIPMSAVVGITLAILWILIYLKLKINLNLLKMIVISAGFSFICCSLIYYL